MKKKGAGHIKAVSDSKILKYAWISGIAMAVLILLNSLVSGFVKNGAYSFVSGLLFQVFVLIFTYGFYVLGKRYESKLLKVISILMISFVVISYLITLAYLNPIAEKVTLITNQLVTDANIQLEDLNSLTQEQQESLGLALMQNQEFLSIVWMIVGLFASYFIVWIILSILFGVALIKLKDKVVYSKIAGILEIVGAATLIVFGLGALVLIVAFVYELIILYKESRKS